MKKSLIFTALFFIFVAQANAQWTTDAWNWGGSNPRIWDYSPTLYRAGSLSIQGLWGGIPEGKGYHFYQNGGGNNSESGYAHFGLSLARFEGANYSTESSDSWANRSVILSGWAGLGFRTKSGGMILHQNGLFSVGLTQNWRDEAVIRHLSMKNDNEVFWGQHYMMYVRHGIVTEKIKVATVDNWPDYVFKKGYHLMPLSQVDTFIQTKGHLPNTLSAAVIEKQGLELGATAKNHQEKIEELFLHLIGMEKRLRVLEGENAQLKTELHHLKQ
jgi:hypothetical protein